MPGEGGRPSSQHKDGATLPCSVAFQDPGVANRQVISTVSRWQGGQRKPLLTSVIPDSLQEHESSGGGKAYFLVRASGPRQISSTSPSVQPTRQEI